MTPTRFWAQMLAAGLVCAVSLAVVLAVGAAATPDWRLW